MPATTLTGKLLSWASEIDQGTIDQASRTARLPFVYDHVALMPDAHVGIGSTVGSVIPTDSAIIPAAVGVDIGCGMIAAETSLTASDLPDNLDALMPLIAARIPAGVGKGHDEWQSVHVFDQIGKPHTELSSRQQGTAISQYGTLGSGNHFVEICLDEGDRVWVVLHSGSRGIGNQLAQQHIANAKGLMAERLESLEDPDLAYLTEGEPAFTAYIDDMLWAQRYAYGSRQLMMNAALTSLFELVDGHTVNTINCHHNFTQREQHAGRELWITRKGAIKAARGDLGVIPGSMGTRSYVVRGLGSELSWDSCSHGAGRRMSRTKAKRELTVDTLREAMAGKSWNADRADFLVDEHPQAYKDIDVVMADQADLVEVVHTLTQVLNYKGQ